MNNLGWTDTLVTSFFMSLGTPGILVATVPATRDAWWALVAAFMVSFSTNVLQHRRQVPREKWAKEDVVKP